MAIHEWTCYDRHRERPKTCTCRRTATADLKIVWLGLGGGLKDHQGLQEVEKYCCDGLISQLG